MRVKALAKINLGLDVLRKRPDGYHDVRMVMQTIRMFDRLDIQKGEEAGISLETNLSYIPVNEGNLVYRAAQLLLDEFSVPQGVRMRLYKYIPVAAGMAGGSSDAAATLYGINRMFHLGLSLRQLMERAVRIGADVPYCLLRGTALAEGIGEKLMPLCPMPPCWILIGKPAVNVSTRLVYGSLQADHIAEHPDIDGLIESLQKKDLKGMASCMGNVLESVTIPMYPVIAEIKELMLSEGALGALMSGSGPTVFGVFDDPDIAKGAAEKLKSSQLAKLVFLTAPYNRRGKRT